MKKSTALWLRKAEGDFRSMRRELKASDANYDDVCIHASQCIEKWMKGILNEKGIEFPKSHDLRRLLSLLVPEFPDLLVMENEMKELTDLAFNIRYPIEFATAEEARRSAELCQNA